MSGGTRTICKQKQPSSGAVEALRTTIWKSAPDLLRHELSLMRRHC